MGGAAWEDRALTYNPKADCSFLVALEDWFMSLGVGLLTFASLETIGIYFGLGKWSYQKATQTRRLLGGEVVAGPAVTFAKSHELNFFKKYIPYVCVFFLTTCEVSERSLAEACGKRGKSHKNSLK